MENNIWQSLVKKWSALTGKTPLPAQIASLLLLALVSVFVVFIVLWVAKLSGVSESFLRLLEILLSPTVIICALVLYLWQQHTKQISGILNWIPTLRSFNLGSVKFDSNLDSASGASPSDTVSKVKENAEKGDADARFSLGVLYHNGVGIEQNHTKAAKQFRLAAEQGHAKAQFSLSVLCRKGVGVEQSHTEAAKWSRLAAEQGHTKAQFNLGVSYHKGEGIAQNYSEAYIWFSLASAGNTPNARKARDQVARKLDSEAMNNAQAEATRREEEIRHKRENKNR